jgi:hypothetical protein
MKVFLVSAESLQAERSYTVSLVGAERVKKAIGQAAEVVCSIPISLCPRRFLGFNICTFQHAISANVIIDWTRDSVFLVLGSNNYLEVRQ